MLAILNLHQICTENIELAEVARRFFPALLFFHLSSNYAKIHTA